MAEIADEQRKMHGEKLSQAVKGIQADAVPGSDDAHAHSHAAHLGTEGKVHLSPDAYGKQGREPGTEIEAPQDPGHRNKGGDRGK